MRKRTPVLILGGAAWTVMMTLLVQREVLPYFEFQAPPSYHTWLAGKEQAEATRYRIYREDRLEGRMETLLRPRPGGEAVDDMADHRLVPQGQQRLVGRGKLKTHP